jgi:hypothetical protein
MLNYLVKPAVWKTAGTEERGGCLCIACFDEAKAFLQDLHERMRSFELALHPDKTRLIRFGRHAAKQRESRGEGSGPT